MNPRPLSSLLLALMLALTGQSMAVARGAAAATGQMVICTGTGPVAVYTDAEGAPTSAPYICPDAALLSVPWPPVLPAPMHWRLASCTGECPRGDATAPLIALHLPQARAPPSPV